MNDEQLAKGLGWFSIGLGLAELVSPEGVGRVAGVRNHRTMLRGAGVRELMSGIGILSQPRAAGWVWSRVVGDIMDLSLLGKELSNATDEDQHRRARNALLAVAGVTALDVLCSVRLSQRQRNGFQSNGRYETNGNGHEDHPHTGKRPMRTAITIGRPLAEVYSFWRDLENLPRFMNHLKSVTVLDDKRSHWVAKGPAGSEVQWDAEIIDEKPNELIAWKSLPGATVENAGSVRFEPATGNRGTVVRVKLQYQPPAGVVGATIAKLFGEAPEKQIPVDLLRVKQLLETGEIARTEGQPAGRPKSTSRRYDDWVRV
jgi:uncharacterized membrane protein